MGVDPVPAAAAFREVDPATRMAVRRHPVVLAAVAGGFVVRALDIAAEVNRDLQRAQILARDLRRDLDRARVYTRVRHLKPGITLTEGADHVLVPGRNPRYFDAVIQLADELGEAVSSILGSPLSLGSYAGEDLEMARQLAEVLGSGLTRVVNATGDNHARARALEIARKQARALDQVCAQNLAGRLCLAQTGGLSEAVLQGALDDFTNADLTHARLAGTDLAGIRWSVTGTTWPPGTDVKALQARSEEVQPGTGIRVFTRTGMMWQPAWQ